MAVFNELQVGRFNRAFQKLVGIKGSPPVRQIGTEILPVFSVPLGVEFRYLESWNRFATVGSPGAVAAQFAAVQLRNPVGSNVIVVVEKCLCSNLTAGAVVFDVSMAPGGGGGAITADLSVNLTPFTQRLDARYGVQANTAIIISAGSTGAKIGNIIQQFSVPANTTTDTILFEDQEITVLPGDTWLVQANVANTSINAAYIWRERFLEDSERS